MSVQTEVVGPSNSELSDTELRTLAYLLGKANHRQIRGATWHELVKKFITVPIELFVLNAKNEIFLVHRRDLEFVGHHHPGTVVNDWETVDQARSRLIAGELIRDAGFTGGISEPQPIGWFECPRDETSTRHAVALLHVSRFDGEYRPREGKGFFPLDALPIDTLHHHVRMIEALKQYLQDGKYITVSA